MKEIIVGKPLFWGNVKGVIKFERSDKWYHLFFKIKLRIIES